MRIKCLCLICIHCIIVLACLSHGFVDSNRTVEWRWPFVPNLSLFRRLGWCESRLILHLFATFIHRDCLLLPSTSIKTISRLNTTHSATLSDPESILINHRLLDSRLMWYGWSIPYMRPRLANLILKRIILPSKCWNRRSVLGYGIRF